MSATSQPAGKPRKKKRNSFLRNMFLGAGTILEISPLQRRSAFNTISGRRSFGDPSEEFEIRICAVEQDVEALQSDWIAVGNDMQSSFEIIETEMDDYVK